jgi:hypothetical protein
MARIKKPYRSSYGVGKHKPYTAKSVLAIAVTEGKKPGNTHTRPVKLTGKNPDVLSHEYESTDRDYSTIQPGEIMPGINSRVNKTAGRPIEKCVPLVGKKQVLRWGDHTNISD